MERITYLIPPGQTGRAGSGISLIGTDSGISHTATALGSSLTGTFSRIVSLGWIWEFHTLEQAWEFHWCGFRTRDPQVASTCSMMSSKVPRGPSMGKRALVYSVRLAW